MESIIGYGLITIMGVVLAAVGGGGSLLAIPILVYLFKVPAELATSYSLALVGFTALIAMYSYSRNGLVQFSLALLFAIPSVLGVLFSRLILMPALPAQLSLGSWVIGKDAVILLSFACLVLLLSFFILFQRVEDREPNRRISKFWVLVDGLLLGAITGFVGAGGGVLIVPALLFFFGLSFREAVGTSLLLIALKSLIGFGGDLMRGLVLDWVFLAVIFFFTVLGVAIGYAVNTRVEQSVLRRGFAVFMMCLAVMMIVLELF